MRSFDLGGRRHDRQGRCGPTPDAFVVLPASVCRFLDVLKEEHAEDAEEAGEDDDGKLRMPYADVSTAALEGFFKDEMHEGPPPHVSALFWIAVCAAVSPLGLGSALAAALVLEEEEGLGEFALQPKIWLT